MPVASATISAPCVPRNCVELLADVAGAGIDDLVGAGGQRRVAAHLHAVDADHRVSPGRQQAAQGELADDAQPQHRGRPAQREAGADAAAHAVAGDAGPGRLVEVEAGGHLPPPAALVADRQQLVRGVIARDS